MKRILKNIFFIGLPIIFLVSIVIFSLPQTRELLSNKDIITIAVVGPMSGKGKAYGKAMLKGINLCFDEFKREGGIPNKEIRIMVLDDKNDQKIAKELASEIADQGKATIVLGHYFSSTSYAASEIYKENGIPAITASATSDNVTYENDWYFRVIPTNSFQGAFIANYMNKTLHMDSASVIYDIDSYGQTLTESFENAAARLGMEVKKKWGFDHTQKTVDDDIERITRELRAMDDPGMIFLATHSGEGVKIVTSLKYPGTNYTIIGPDAFGGEAFIKYLREYPQEKLLPGYYSNGIYTISPFIIDIANEKAQIFRREFLRKYSEEPSWVAAGYYDAMAITLNAIKNAGIDGKKTSVVKDRMRMRDFLSNMTSVENGYEGVNGIIHFNVDGDFDKPLAVGVYNNQKLVSTLTQYQLITDLNTVDNMFKEILEGNIILIDGKFMNKTQLVYSGVDVNSISDLNVTKASCVIDFYIWFRFEGEFDDTNIEFVNSVNPLKLGTPIMEEKEGLLTTRAYRVKAPFKVDFNFHDYPFDSQTLRIQLRHVKLTRDRLIYISDILGMRLNRNVQKKDAFNELSGWTVDNQMFFQDIITNNSTLGVPKFFTSHNSIKYSQFNASILIKRQIVSFLIKNLILIFVMIVISYLTYLIPPDQFSIRISIGMSTLLTTAFSHIKLSQSLPVGYLLAIEHAFFGVYGLAALSILISVFIYKLYQKTIPEDADRKTKELAKKKIKYLTIIGLIVHPLIVIFVAFVLTYIYVLNLTNIINVLIMIAGGLIGIIGFMIFLNLKKRSDKKSKILPPTDSKPMVDTNTTKPPMIDTDSQKLRLPLGPAV